MPNFVKNRRMILMRREGSIRSSKSLKSWRGKRKKWRKRRRMPEDGEKRSSGNIVRGDNRVCESEKGTQGWKEEGRITEEKKKKKEERKSLGPTRD